MIRLLGLPSLLKNSIPIRSPHGDAQEKHTYCTKIKMIKNRYIKSCIYFNEKVYITIFEKKQFIFQLTELNIFESYQPCKSLMFSQYR